VYLTDHGPRGTRALKGSRDGGAVCEPGRAVQVSWRLPPKGISSLPSRVPWRFIYLYQNAPWFCYLFPCFPGECQTLYHLLSHHCHLRFGRALSMVRSANMKKNKRLALEFMRRARKTTNALDSRARTNNMWLKHAGLKPVIEFLSKR
jgi:hypothetical protein